MHHTNGVTVFVTEELEDVGALGDFAACDLCPTYPTIFNDALVDELLNVGQLAWGKRLAVEIEGELVRSNIRTFLRSIGANNFVQCPVKNMGDGVMPLNGGAAVGIDLQLHSTPLLRCVSVFY